MYKHLPNAFNLISSRIRPIVSALKRQVRPGNQLAKSLSAQASSVVPARHSVCALPICMFTRSLVYACVCVGVCCAPNCIISESIVDHNELQIRRN